MENRVNQEFLEVEKPTKYRTLESLCIMGHKPIETLREIKTRIDYLHKWGFREEKLYKDKLVLFRVSSYNHKGYITVAKNWNDTHIISLINVQWKVLKTIENVAFSDLYETLNTILENKTSI